MKFHIRRRSVRVMARSWLLILLSVAGAMAKPVHLRNETLSPAPRGAAVSAAAQASAPSALSSGLFLIQFAEPPSAELRSSLESAGVQLLQYVPEDTFVARFHKVRIEQVRVLPGVEWVGNYRPDHKVHQGVRGQAKALAGNQSLAVAVLMEPKANASESAGIRGLFHALQQESASRHGTVLRGQIKVAQLDALASSDAVLWIEPAPKMKLFDEVASKIVAGDGGPGVLHTQTLGYDGSGVKVAVADSGLNNGNAETMHPDLTGRTPAFFWYGTNLTDAADEHSHGTHVAGIVAGNGATGETDENGTLYGLGVAPGASIIAQRIFDGVGNYEAPPSYERLTRDAKRAGADIGSNSWGDDTQGRYDVSAMEFDELVRDADGLADNDQPYILEFSAGNAGPGVQTIGSPAVGKNVIATGASENDRPDFIVYADSIDTMADFSSRGPCEDGRIKPDIVAPGTWIASLQSASATAEYAWAPISDFYQFQGGTSQAGPHASGAAAVFVQYYRQTHAGMTPSPALVKAALINSAVDMYDEFSTGPVPNMDEGWGRIDVGTLVDGSVSFEFTDQTVLLTNSQLYERQVLVGGAGQPLKLTLAYTDVPGFPGALPALVNDLDLEVIGPDGTLYRGNQFSAGDSAPNPPVADRINNVEGVHLYNPVPGLYTVRVRAYKIVKDARRDTAPVIDQDFALVISGDMASPGTGMISLDRQFYRAPDQIKVRVTDTDLAGQPSISVTLRSATESTGESFLLRSSSASGVFTGAVATATSSGAGKLQVAHGDFIEARYLDASAGVTRVATASADLLPPALTNIAAARQYGQAVISWQSDEPASSVIRYGTNNTLAGLNLTASDSALTTNHLLTATGLAPGKTYYYCVISTDEAGNAATNSNNGQLFSFVATSTAPVLVINQNTNISIVVLGFPFNIDVPPLSDYTDALDQAGVDYDVWDAATAQAPLNLAALPSYQAVLWRPSDFYLNWGPAEQVAISNYLHSGGAMLVSSMEILTLLGNAGYSDFIKNVLHVNSFVPDPGSAGGSAVGEIIGSEADPVTQGLDILLDYTFYEDNYAPTLGYADASDTITPEPDASAILRNEYGEVAGLRWPVLHQTAPGRLVFLSFPLEAVPMSGGVNDRVNLFRNFLSFLAPGGSRLGTVSFDSTAYRLPSMAAVEVGDADLAGAGSLTVTVSSSTDTNPVSLLLRESSTGVFSGAFTIFSATNAPAAGAVRAQAGDTLEARYFDASAGNTIKATASIDTNPPAITGVAPEVDYTQAIISWDTSEPTDSLVQFGESALLDRSAYEAEFISSHSVVLPFLIPDTTYYYRVVSRDAAGNATTDDNTNRLYSFRTLRPLFPPWSDNLDAGATNWTTYVSPDSDFFGFGSGAQPNWTLGAPDNSLDTSAHSPPNAWGSNLNGDSIDLAECYLISPAIFLTNGNVATLTFWQNYDFPDLSGYDIEIGEVQVITQDGVATPLAQFSDSSYGWEEASYELTPFMGKIVYVAWYYFLFGLDVAPRPGWLVDDVSITTASLTAGSVRITNNLWQAAYLLSGAMSKRGSGLSTLYTNAPPGTYILEFADRPYYNTPLPQTNTLAPGGALVLQGAYTFPDTNHNGISDLWEQRFFGNVSAYRADSTDTDGDGMSDLQEFIAGTDPNSPPRQFRLTASRLAPSSVRLEWPSVPGQQYRVLTSSNAVSWTPHSSWMEATGTVSRSDVPISAGGRPALFKVQTGATNSPAGMLPNLRLTVQRPSPGAIRLEWPAVPTRAYRVLGSTNFVTWTPLSDWFQSAVTPAVWTNTAAAGAPCLYRVEVRP